MRAVGAFRWSPSWLVPALLLVIPLLFAALPGGPARRLVADARLARGISADTATMNIVRAGFIQARATERDTLSARSVRAHDTAVAEVRRALDSMPDEPGMSEPLRTLRESFAHYAGTLGTVAETRSNDAASNAIEVVLTRLQTSDEARLREPLAGMRLAEVAFRSEDDPRAVPELSRWAGIFATRLDELAIPEGTRATLAALFATHQHDAQATNDALVQQRQAGEVSQVAARAVELALADADRVLNSEQRRVTTAFNETRDQIWWQFGTALLAVALMTTGRVVTTGRAHFAPTLRGRPS